MDQPAVEAELRKQVSAAKCAFSKRWNDSYVLASVVTGSVPGAELTQTINGCCLLLLLLLQKQSRAFMNGLAPSSDGITTLDRLLTP